MKSARCLIIACLAITACSSGSIISSTIGDNAWSLRATEDQALMDVQHAEFGTYPNPRNVMRMTVTVTDDGTLCANDGDKHWCGGPLQGIPYLTVLNVQPTFYCVRVVDMYGNEVRQGCADGEPPEEVFMGQSNIVGPASGDGTQPVDTVDTEDIVGDGDQTSQPSPQDGVLVGTSLVINKINEFLGKIGLKTRVEMPSDKDSLADFDQGDITLGRGTCADVLEYLDDEFSDDHEGTDDYLFGEEAIAECLEDGRCRIGQLVTRAMAEACKLIPDDVDVFSAETGIIGGGGQAIEDMCSDDVADRGEIDTCVGSPLVLDLLGDGLQLKGIGGGATFALSGSGPMQVGWLAGSDDGLLAIDLDGDGRISSGRELFGEATGGWAPNGFAALARHDDDSDGAITPADAIYERLVVWRDNGDGQSERSELSSLADVGVRSIPLDCKRIDRTDRFGNYHGLAGAASARGKSVPVIDVWFRMQRASR